MEKKYELIEQKNGLFRIRALRDFSFLSKGDMGGYVQSEANLSQEGNCWIDPTSVVLENAVVSENAYIGAGSVINGNAQIRGKASISHSYVSENAVVEGNVELDREASIRGETHIDGDAQIFYANISGKSSISGKFTVVGYGFLRDAFIRRDTDVVFVNLQNIALTFYLSQIDNRNRICVCDGARSWTLDKFNLYISQKYPNSPRAQIFNMAAEMAKAQIREGFKRAKNTKVEAVPQIGTVGVAPEKKTA